jgi:hypothetical protein
MAAAGLFGQYKGSPVKKDKLLGVLKSRQLQTREIVNVIKSNGVDFQVTTPIELELYEAGARPEVIAAAKSNYRSVAVAVAPTKTGAGPKTNFTGQPLTKDAVETLLQNGVADAQIRKNITARGVSFRPSAADKAELKSNGGSAALIALIDASYANPNQNAASNNDTGSSRSAPESYDNLVDKAVEQYDKNKDTAGAIATLEQAVKSDPKEARAYQQLGFMYLYGQKNFVEAEKNMREAINRGGSAVFRVFHDHDSTFINTCQGSLFIAKDGIRFESDNNKHTFETSDANIRQIKMNSIFKTFYKVKAGSFKVVLKSGEDDSVNYNFAPLTDNSQESKIILRLIGK